MNYDNYEYDFYYLRNLELCNLENDQEEGFSFTKSKVQLLKMKASLDNYQTKVTQYQAIVNTLLTRVKDPTNISELINEVSNSCQRDILSRLINNSGDRSNEMYLSKYETNTSQDKRKQNLHGTFTVLGTIRKGKREAYTIKFYKKPTLNVVQQHSFACSCPDHKFNSIKKNICCKHVCFLLCKVAKLFQPEFFETKVLDDETYDKFKEIAENLHHVITPVNAEDVEKEDAAAVNEKFPEKFKLVRKQVCADDLCPICYDDMQIPTSLLSCPDCSNNVHAECMKVWLESRKTCVYCRSSVWRSCKSHLSRDLSSLS